MSRKTPKTLVGHGIALLLKDRNIGTVDGTPTLTDWRKGRYTLAMGTIETFNGVTGAFTATLTVAETRRVTLSPLRVAWKPLQGHLWSHAPAQPTRQVRIRLPAKLKSLHTPAT